jgi:hypothetical protein
MERTTKHVAGDSDEDDDQEEYKAKGSLQNFTTKATHQYEIDSQKMIPVISPDIAATMTPI